MGNRLSSFRTPHKKIDEFGRYLPNADDDDEGDTIDPNNICKICYCRPVDCRLERCGHEISCYSCAMTSSVGKICPLCRQTVVMVINKAPPPPPPSPAMPTSP
ncbi:hypothetical protein FOZ60_002586 [Perkinsus olseni]|uniref:RING-type domain-containing protein n=1 Tax=Perkinsus olseni TaxID=32597 RepID=A0A7J6NXG6_PEROL|nr:hypothetical protein FOZ60_002586 [Perkinsus olseni]